VTYWKDCRAASDPSVGRAKVPIVWPQSTKLCVCAAALVLASFSLTVHAADAPAFPPLEAAPPDGSVYVLGSEAELRAWPSWTDLEARTLEVAQLTRGSFAGANGLKIHYRLYRHRAESRGGVVIVSGRTEGLVLYQETIHDLVRNGYSVYIHDHRGQGFSQRLLSTDLTMGYIDEFDNYVKDLSAFIDGPVRTVRGDERKPLFLLAHSMGGAVAALYLEGARDSSIAAAALVTPMMEPWAAGEVNPGVGAKVADAFCDRYSVRIAETPLISWLLSKRYADGASFDEEYAKFRAAPSELSKGNSQSLARYARNWETMRNARCSGADCGSAEAKVGGASYRWFNQSCNASQRARGKMAASITLPVLLLQGGDDRRVKPQAQQEFCNNLNQAHGKGYCIGRTVAHASHSVLIEADIYRAPALRRVLGFFDCVRSGISRCD